MFVLLRRVYIVGGCLWVEEVVKFSRVSVLYFISFFCFLRVRISFFIRIFYYNVIWIFCYLGIFNLGQNLFCSGDIRLFGIYEDLIFFFLENIGEFLGVFCLCVLGEVKFIFDFERCILVEFK